MADKKLKVTLMRSTAGMDDRRKACIRGLGLRRIRHTVEVEDTPAIRGIIGKISYMIQCEEI